ENALCNRPSLEQLIQPAHNPVWADRSCTVACERGVSHLLENDVAEWCDERPILYLLLGSSGSERPEATECGWQGLLCNPAHLSQSFGRTLTREAGVQDNPYILRTGTLA